MKWDAVPVTQKFLFIFGCVCGFAYIVLSFFALCGCLSIPAEPFDLLFGIFWLCMAMTTKSKILAIVHYVLAGMWLLSGIIAFVAFAFVI